MSWRLDLDRWFLKLNRWSRLIWLAYCSVTLQSKSSNDVTTATITLTVASKILRAINLHSTPATGNVNRCLDHCGGRSCNSWIHFTKMYNQFSCQKDRAQVKGIIHKRVHVKLNAQMCVQMQCSTILSYDVETSQNTSLFVFYLIHSRFLFAKLGKSNTGYVI